MLERLEKDKFVCLNLKSILFGAHELLKNCGINAYFSNWNTNNAQNIAKNISFSSLNVWATTLFAFHRQILNKSKINHLIYNNKDAIFFLRQAKTLNFAFYSIFSTLISNYRVVRKAGFSRYVTICQNKM